MTAWAVVIPDERYEAERLFHHDTLELAGRDDRHRPAIGDEVLVVHRDGPPRVVALGRVRATPDGREGIRTTRRRGRRSRGRWW
ncbi:hypothetical protein GCM10027605_07740 [Micromonospora zhanjiangensis]